MRKSLIFSSFVLKIFALLFMTLDHIGLLFEMLPNVSYTLIKISNVFRTLGRMALPLFIFMIVEGVMHTKSFKKYCGRLAIFTGMIAAVFLCLTYIPLPFDVSSILGAGNIFLDLLLTAIAVYCINHKDFKIKLLTLLPLALSIISFCVKSYEYSTNNAVLWYPPYLYLQYDWISIVLGIFFSFARKLSNMYIDYFSSSQNVDRYVFDSNGTTQIANNVLSIVALCIVAIGHYLIGYYYPNLAFWDYKTQIFSMCAGLLILFYNGKRGYNAKWFQYGCYIYYPFSLIILALVYMFI